MKSKLRAGAYGLALLSGTAVGLSPFRMSVVCGDSMSPSLNNGNLCVLDRRFPRQALRRGDVVVFRAQGTAYVKRILATEGDTVYLMKERIAGQDEDGDDLVMDWQLPRLQRIVRQAPWKESFKMVARRVPKGYCYVVGDNMEVSVDSREFGPVPLQAIQGKVLFAPPPQPDLDHIAGSFPSEGHS